MLDGRDIGTVICPDAEVKLFVTADACRARPAPARRTARRAGRRSALAELEAQIAERDRRDIERARIRRCIRRADAHVLDTTDLSITEAVAAAVAIVEKARA